MDKWVEVLGSKPTGASGTAKEWGTSAATLCAIVKRGYMSKTNTSPAVYTKLPAAANYLRAMVWLMRHPNEDNYIDLYRSNEKLGMLCRVVGHDIVDCYDQLYDMTDVAGIVEWDENGHAYHVSWKELYREVAKR